MLKKSLAALLVFGALASTASANNSLDKTFKMVKETNQAQVEATKKANQQVIDNRKAAVQADVDKQKADAKAKADAAAKKAKAKTDAKSKVNTKLDSLKLK